MIIIRMLGLAEYLNEERRDGSQRLAIRARCGNLEINIEMKRTELRFVRGQIPDFETVDCRKKDREIRIEKAVS